MSQKIRTGNDIDITWSLKDASVQPYIVEGKDVAIELNVGTKRVRIKEFELSENHIHFVYYGKDQKHVGVYALKYIENDGKPEMVTYDTKDAFTLVEHSWQAVDDGETPETIQLEIVTVASELLERVGPRGYSAYEIAVQEGFVGTEDEWLESLKGEDGEPGQKGEPGPQGAQGPQGEKGETGATGATGPQGPQGEKGEKGDKGDTGETGDTGPQGIQGEKGEKGDKGDKGEKGEKGDKGDKGDKGEKGDKGNPGSDANVTAQNIQNALGYTPANASALNDKQDTLVSGTNIKTVNNQSLLGSGNIVIQGGSGEQSDWNETDTTSEAYIKNKPSIPSALSDLTDDSTHRTVSDTEKSSWDAKYNKPSTGIPASDIAQGVIPDVSNFITKTVDDLVNYYTKSETYTKAEVQTLINAIKQFTYQTAQTLPTASADTMHIIYLVPSSDPQTQNVKDEYITIDNGTSAQTRYTWEQIGSTAIDLSDYVTTTELNTALDNYTTTTDLTTLLAGKQDVISDLTTIRSGASAGATAYQKPGTGIPASDLASGVIPDVSGKENTSNKVTSISSASTDTQYPSAKCVYDLIGDVETLINAL